MEFTQKWCLDDEPVPLVHRRMDFWDQYQVSGDNEVEEVEDKPFYTLNLKATMKAQWLLKHLKLPCSWWRTHWAEVCLVQEILAFLNDKKRIARKTQKGVDVLVATRANLVVAVKIRDIKFLVVHDTRALTVCFTIENVHDEFLLFFETLKQDIEALDALQTSENIERERKPKRYREKSETLENIASECAENIKQHPSCRTSCFNPSRGCLKVNGKFYHIPHYKKKRIEATREDNEESWQSLQAEFLKAAAAAIEDLNQAHPRSGSSSNLQPLAETEAQPEDSFDAIQNDEGPDAAE